MFVRARACVYVCGRNYCWLTKRRFPPIGSRPMPALPVCLPACCSRTSPFHSVDVRERERKECVRPTRPPPAPYQTVVRAVGSALWGLFVSRWCSALNLTLWISPPGFA